MCRKTSFLGKLLNEVANKGLTEVTQKLDDFYRDMTKAPENLDELTNVLNVISIIRGSTEEVETKYRDVMECYRTLTMYNYPVDMAEKALADDLPNRWDSIATKASEVDTQLVPIKIKFTETTVNQVKEFRNEIKIFKQEFLENGPGTGDLDMDRGLEALLATKESLARLNERREQLVRAEKLFNLPISSYSDLYDVEHQVKELERIYELYSDVKQAIGGWATLPWSSLDVSALSKGIEIFGARLEKLPKEFKRLAPYNVVSEKIYAFRDSIPLYADLKNEALRERHWRKLMDVTNRFFDLSPETFTMEKVFSMNLSQHAETVGEIVNSATKELSIENGIKEIENSWRNTRFNVIKYSKGTDDRGYIIGAIDEIQTALDDNSLNLQSMSASKYVAAFLPTVQKWEKLLSLIGEVLEVWMVVQRKWMYLESIFVGAGDIRQQLPEEAAKFDHIDKAFKKIMTETAKQPSVIEACNVEGRLDALQALSSSLESCQKSLSDYLETKRNAFPRFFFISDEELLSILGSHDPRNVQEHIIKMFDNVLKLNFGTGRNERLVQGMSSTEGETLDFRTARTAEGRVEDWMGAIEGEMKRTNRIIHKEAVWKYAEMNRMQWYTTFQGMATLAAGQVWWTWEVEDVFRKFKKGEKLAMKKLSKMLAGNLEELVVAVRSDLSPNQRKKINSQIIIDVHARDIVDRFVRDSIMDDQEFEWESQLRFYWDKQSDHLLVRQCNGTFDYGYEYMGLNGRLVITPLTDRCYLTLTQAVSMKLGGAPAGPGMLNLDSTVYNKSSWNG